MLQKSYSSVNISQQKKTKRKHYKLIYKLNTKNELPIYTGQFTLCKRNITSRHVARS